MLKQKFNGLFGAQTFAADAFPDEEYGLYFRENDTVAVLTLPDGQEFALSIVGDVEKVIKNMRRGVINTQETCRKLHSMVIFDED